MVSKYVSNRYSPILTCILVILGVLFCTHESEAAYWKVVIDPKCLTAVTSNTLAISAIEEQHNVKLDSIAKKKELEANYTTTMALIKEAYKYSMENVKGFGQESKYYIEIGTLAADIVMRLPDLATTISHSNLSGKVACVTEIGNLLLRTQQLVSDFVNIVNNAKVANPLGNNPGDKGDGYNMLSRYDRLSVANRIYADLQRISYKLDYMEYLAQFATWNQTLFKLDPTTWVTIMGGKNIADDIINRWRNL